MEECSICFENVSEHNYKFTCRHVFHSKCIEKWKGSCPNCRAKVNDASCMHNYVLTQSCIPPFGKINKCTRCHDLQCIVIL